MPEIILSIVIPSYNSEQFILPCLRSIEEEACDGVEFILIDGGSTDRTMGIVKRYEHLFTQIITEPDQGQSDAFNKGFKLARGKFLSWLNSDDVFCKGSLKRVVDFIKLGDMSWYVANSIYIDSNSKVLRCCQSGKFEHFALRFGLLSVFGPSTIISKNLFLKAGKFREDFHFCMDTEYWWRLVKLGYRYKRIPVYLWALRLHDSAKTASAITGEFNKRPCRMQKEGAIIGEVYYPNRSNRKHKIGVLLLRMYRFLNGSYVSAIRDTFKNRGRNVSEIDFYK